MYIVSSFSVLDLSACTRYLNLNRHTLISSEGSTAKVFLCMLFCINTFAELVAFFKIPNVLLYSFTYRFFESKVA